MKEATGHQYDYNRKHIEDQLDEIGKGNTIAICWSIEDVQAQASDRGVPITEDQCRDVLSLMDRKHDACIGINWDTIDYWIEVVVEDEDSS